MSRVFNQSNNSFNQTVYFNNPVVTGPIIITAAGVVSEAFSSTGIMLDGGAYTVTIAGLLSATASNSYGLYLGYAAPATPNQISTITIGTTGEVYGALFAIMSNHAVNITNNGALYGNNGIHIAGSDVAYTIINTGEISTSFGVYAIWADDTANHTITNSGIISGHIVGNSLAASIETINNSGSLYGEIQAFDGADTITNTGLIYGAIYLDAGDDNLNNEGTITGDVNGWTGIDNIQNSGTLNGYLLAGDGNDILSNSGTIDGGVDGWTGNDRLTNTGVVNGWIYMRDGSDTFTNTGIVNGWISMGEGNDRFVGGNSAENIADESGNDSYNFGDGIDNFDAVGAGSNVGNDSIHGGLNTDVNTNAGIYGDIYNAFDALGAVNINLDTVARIDSISGLTYVASRAQGAEIGTDTVRAFEVVYTGAGDDIIFGNAASNSLSASAGNDHIFGGAGNDFVMAGEGADTLVGDIGRDNLDGGYDSDLDTFIFKSLADSTVARSGRDMIVNFNESDRIDFSQMVLATGDVNHFVGLNTAFDGLTGAVRVLTTTTGWLIQADANGDTIADMAISVLGHAHLNVVDWSDNFLF